MSAAASVKRDLPRLPPGGVPAYLKPIPWNTRHLPTVLDSVLKREKPEIVRVLYSTWTAEGESPKFQEIRNSIVSGELSEKALKQWQEDYAAKLAGELRPFHERIAREGARALSESVAGGAGQNVPWGSVAEPVAAWVDAHGAELVADISEGQRQALKFLSSRYTAGTPINPRELGRMMRAVVALTPDQARGVALYRDALAADAALSQERREALVQNYAGYQWRVRAERIARTETATAFNEAGFQVVAQAASGIREPIFKTWDVAYDERTCPLCMSMDGKTIGLEEFFRLPDSRGRKVRVPPAHPNCRCTAIYGVDA